MVIDFAKNIYKSDKEDRDDDMKDKLKRLIIENVIGKRQEINI